MAEQIRIDYDKLAEAQKRFATISDTVATMQQELKTAIEPMRSGAWQGAGFDSFARELVDEIVPARRALATALQEAGPKVGEIMKVMREAEEQATQAGRSGTP